MIAKFSGLTFNFFNMEGSERVGITVENTKGIHTDIYIDPKQLQVVSTRNDVIIPDDSKSITIHGDYPPLLNGDMANEFNKGQWEQEHEEIPPYDDGVEDDWNWSHGIKY